MMSPNFFLIGGPKCGTTALARYLSDHPSVFLTEPKEPYYLAEDLRPMASSLFGIRTDDDYDRLFAAADPDRHNAVGEATTLYLSSPSAAQAIAGRYPDARLIAMVRDPVEVAAAYHMQMTVTFRDDVEDFATAWDACDSRRAGAEVPPACKVPRMLWYDEIPRFGRQLDRWHRHFPAEQLLVLSFDDFRRDPAAVYRTALDFLDLPDDRREHFARHNVANVPRSRLMNRMYNSGLSQRTLLRIKRWLPDPVVERVRYLPRKILRRDQSRRPIDDGLRRRLEDHFRDDYATALSLVTTPSRHADAVAVGDA